MARRIKRGQALKRKPTAKRTRATKRAITSAVTTKPAPSRGATKRPPATKRKPGVQTTKAAAKRKPASAGARATKRKTAARAKPAVRPTTKRASKAKSKTARPRTHRAPAPATVLVAAPARRMAEPPRRLLLEPSPFGVNSHTAGNDLIVTLAEAGIRWHRIDINWDELEPGRGVHAWAELDRLVELATQRNLQLYGSIAYTPAWASGGKPREAAPNDGADYVAFVRAVARRYRGRPLVALGLWNEPNLRQFYQGTLDFYLNALVVPGLRALHEEAPEIARCGPDLSSSKDVDKWLDAVSSAAGPLLDVLTHHQYDGKDRVDRRVQAIDDLRKKLERFGFGGRPLWISEIGWDVPHKATPETQAEHLRGVMAAMQARRDWWQKTFWYDSHGPTWGLLGADGTPQRGRPTPAFHAYRDVIARSDAPRPTPEPRPGMSLAEARHIVICAYRAILGRGVDDDDPARDTTARELLRGLSLLALCQGLFASAEFASRRAGLGAEELAEELYRHVLGRAADPDGLAGTVSELRAGRGPERVVAMFESDEFRRRPRLE